MASKAKMEFERELAQFVGGHRPSLQADIEALHVATLASIAAGQEDAVESLVAAASLPETAQLNPLKWLRDSRLARERAAAERQRAEQLEREREQREAVKAHPVSKWAWLKGRGGGGGPAAARGGGEGPGPATHAEAVAAAQAAVAAGKAQAVLRGLFEAAGAVPAAS